MVENSGINDSMWQHVESVAMFDLHDVEYTKEELAVRTEAIYKEIVLDYNENVL